MRDVITIDCETDPFLFGRVPAPFIWGAYSERYGFQTFRHASDLIDWLAGKKVVVYAHNGGKFDFMYLIPYITTFKELRIINGRLAKFKIGAAEFRDSFCILPVPLRAYKKEDFDYKLMEQETRAAHMEKIVRYLRADCVYLHELVTAYRNQYGDALTIASSALRVWSKMAGVKAPVSTRNYFDTFHPYCYGGRVECLASGEVQGPISIYDVNSAYPFAMKQRLSWGFDPLRVTTLPKHNMEQGFYTVKAPSRGAFPFRDEKGALTFPRDKKTREFLVSGWEVAAAMRTCMAPTEIKVLDGWAFNETITFDRYVDHFYLMKANAADDSPERLFAKLYLNSLFGKFYANPTDYKSYILIPSDQVEYIEHSTEYRFHSVAGNMVLMARPLDETEMVFRNAATGASVTGHARANLWENGLCKCEKALYCDTDSVHTLGAFNGDTDNKRLGAFKPEAVGSVGYYAGKKLYAVRCGDKWKKASKGAKLTGEEIASVAKGAVINYKSEAPTMAITSGTRFLTRQVRKTV